MSAAEFVLEMKDIVKDFPGVRALDGVQLHLRKGTIHSLMGENGAGKSTLMKCLFGIYNEDAGEILIDGKQTSFENPKEALEHGVSMVHQELNQVMKRNIMENIWLGRFPKKGPFVDEKKMYEDTLAVFEQLGIELNPRTIIGKLSVSQRQMVEIAKAVSYGARILVLDEPTSSLSDKEIEHLFRILNRLRDQGVAIIYISHKMEEILRISDDVTIMRDGQWIATEPASELSTDKIIQLMVGRKLENRYPEKTNVPGEVMLDVKQLTGMFEPAVKDISFQLRKGEVLGVAGLVGSGRTELLETIFGAATKLRGEMVLNGRALENKTPRESIRNGFAYLTEERRATGIFGNMDITANTVIANLKAYKHNGFIDNKRMVTDTGKVIKDLRVKTPNQRVKISNLSGGNQQKVILGRWLLTNADIYLLDEPTRGIDVGAKFEIYQIILNLAKEGKSVIVVSSEMPELLGICDRILVMSNKQVAGIEKTSNLNQEKIMTLAAKYV